MENTIPTLPGLPGVKKEKYIISIIIFILAVAVAYLAWYVNGRQKVPTEPVPVPVTAPVAEDIQPTALEKTSLGGNIYEQTQDPIKDKIPESVAPVTNPLGGAYKNPFE